MAGDESMIKFTEGDILHADTEAIVNTVNCVGVMGRGIALQFKNAYPDNFKFYKKACDRDEVQPGKMLVYETGQLMNPRYIINFPTKRHWRGKSRIEDIESGLEDLVFEVKARKISSISIPPLGSGLGGLPWSSVRPLIEKAFSKVTHSTVIIYEPTKDSPFTKPIDVPDMTPGRAAMVKLVERYLGGLMDPFVTLLEIQKLMYFMQEYGEPLSLHYVKERYGPYSPNLRHVLKKVDGHLISGYGDSGDNPEKHLHLVPGAVKDADAFLEDKTSSTRDNLDRVFSLVGGFETSFGLELLATVHWVLKENTMIDTDAELVSLVHNWGPEKRKFNERQIIIARDTLLNNGLLV